MMALGLLREYWERAMTLVPFYLFVWSVVSAWTVIGDFCVLGTFAPLLDDPRFERSATAQLAKGVVVVVLFALLKGAWVGSWLFGLMLDARYRENSPRAKRTMQCDDDTWLRLEGGQIVNHRFRNCGRCDTPLPLGDRMYHCSTNGVHYPVYDHYCFWLHLTVFLHTIKPYLFLCATLSANAVFVFAVSLYTAVTTPSTWQHVAVAFGSLLVLALMAFQVTLRQWYLLAFRNCPGPEGGKQYFHLVRWLEGRRVQVVKLPAWSGKLASSPWELHWTDNLREALGDSVWSWFFFWVIPGRVLRWEADDGEESDFPLGRLWHDFVEGRSSLRLEWIREFVRPSVLDELTVAPTTAFPTSWISRRRGARSTGVDFEMV